MDSDGRSYFLNTLMGIENIKIPKDDLRRYDANILSYVREINSRREPITLKYFQYLAVLFAEIVLDNLKNRKDEFLSDLNEFLKKVYNKQKQDIRILDQFNEDDLRKLAFWMATGAGKTLIMHINYHQFFQYRLFSPDNIILITPNEGLSRQHFDELQKSGISSRLYTGTLTGGLREENEILVIEMTKFVEEKKGGGVTLPVDVFEGRNLVFVDEGHKGKRSEEQKWARLRNELAQNGFVFEYSATFGQILSEQNQETLKEYAKSIVFDYSYKYFYLDGYGKNFSVLNVRHPVPSERPSKRGEWEQKFQEGMFVANLLSFYEQILIYEENKALIREYNLEKPLWIFVGTTVTGKEEESDVIQIVEFIRRVIQDENWVRNWVNKILNGEAIFRNEEGKDVFQDRFQYLRGRGIDFDDLYRKVFGGRGGFGLYELKKAEGELGLKVGENKYFGVINIGDVSGFKRQLEGKEISVGQDAISDSLFDDIKKEDSQINLLIGAKKFIEGWDTWRVSSMGLLNIGTGQGPQIIQLFGRGVRLKGKGMSLKRSGENAPVQILETLNIYGIKADYLDRFLAAISKEEVEFETIEIPIKPQHQDKWESLYTLSKPEKRFEEEEVLRLEIDEKIYYTIDLLPRVSIYRAEENREEGIRAEEVRQEVEERNFSPEQIDLVDWQRILQETVEFKAQRNYWNLVFDGDDIKNILLCAKYKILAPPDVFEVKDERDIKRLEDIALLVIKKYLDLFYRKNARRFESENLKPEKGVQLPLPFVSDRSQGYIVQIDRRKAKLLKEIRNLRNDLNKLLQDDQKTLPRVYFDGSLYVPILLQSKEIDKITPAGLVESEKDFVSGLKSYLQKNNDQLEGVEVYLLRNYPFSGVGFQLQWAGFYPDFIMWVKKGAQQIITFIDPKGLEHTKGLDDEKIQFANGEIKELEAKLHNENIKLASFILSRTSYQQLIMGLAKYPSKDDYIQNNVLFLEDKEGDNSWPKLLIEKILSEFSAIP